MPHEVNGACAFSLLVELSLSTGLRFPVCAPPAGDAFFSSESRTVPALLLQVTLKMGCILCEFSQDPVFVPSV